MYGPTTPEQRKQYHNMTQAEIIRSLPDGILNRYAKRGAPNAVMEQAYRHNLIEAWNAHPDELSDFERAILVEGGL